MNLRDKIAYEIQWLPTSEVWECKKTTDAILATIKANVPDLVWNGLLVASPMPYQIWADNGGSDAPDDPFIKFNNYRVFEPIGFFSIGEKGNLADEFETLEEAKATANAHHKAQVLQAMGIEQ